MDNLVQLIRHQWSENHGHWGSHTFWVQEPWKGYEYNGGTYHNDQGSVLYKYSPDIFLCSDIVCGSSV